MAFFRECVVCVFSQRPARRVGRIVFRSRRRFSEQLNCADLPAGQDSKNERRVWAKRGSSEAVKIPTSAGLWFHNRSETGCKRACQLRWFIPQSSDAQLAGSFFFSITLYFGRPDLTYCPEHGSAEHADARDGQCTAHLLCESFFPPFRNACATPLLATGAARRSSR